MTNSISISLSKHWGSGTSNPKFRHPKGTYSAVVGGNMGTCNEMWEFNTRMTNNTTEVKVETCPNDKAADRLTTIIPIE